MDVREDIFVTQLTQRGVEVMEPEPYIEKDWITKAGVRAVVLNTGHRCGYIEVKEDSPLCNVHYNNICMEVHGGLTYSARDSRYLPTKGWWLGFDCAHLGDATAWCNRGVLRSLDYCVNECESMATQLVKLEGEM